MLGKSLFYFIVAKPFPWCRLPLSRETTMRKSALTKVCPSCQDDGLFCPACDTGRHCEAIAPVCDTCKDDGLACHVCEGDNDAEASEGA